MFDAIAELPVRLTSLKTLHIDSLPFIEKLRNHSLETLRWVGPTQPGHLDTILSRQGQSLTHLEYRCDELDCPTWPTHTNITDLALSAPALQHLSINLPRNPNGTWPLNHLSALSRMPSLTTADLYFQLQAPCEAQRYLLGTRINCGRAYRQLERCSGPDSFAAPYLNATTALHMFRWLRTEGTSQRLAAVTFRTGDWTVGRQTWWSQPFVSDRRSAVHCRVEGEREVCEAQNEGYWQRYFGRDLEWDGETWVVDDDLEDFEEAEYQGDVGWMDSLREKMRKRIEAFDR
ncbi:hypothetical protein C7974DRAFT_304410 [Boeremia exigua]|uniref:uncharacterized protein n=1 Tax=Boeremia exigua TaxID=749465 RepID=UPI001E8E4794|nr:uncharacterized protein C7974DRAFT_304410 [Boeremia exigua]KAH6639310.1 hypothetical protein C7974DRAFT_304410 [Boeremia exigua]